MRDIDTIANTEQLGAAIRAAREACEWSQASIGRNTGLSPTTVVKLESGSGTVRLQTLRRLLAVFRGVSPRRQVIIAPHIAVIAQAAGEAPPDATAIRLAPLAEVWEMVERAVEGYPQPRPRASDDDTEARQALYGEWKRRVVEGLVAEAATLQGRELERFVKHLLLIRRIYGENIASVDADMALASLPKDADLLRKWIDHWGDLSASIFPALSLWREPLNWAAWFDTVPLVSAAQLRGEIERPQPEAEVEVEVEVEETDPGDN